MKIESLSQLYKYIVDEGNTFESIKNIGLCECCGNEVYLDQDFNDFVAKINANVELSYDNTKATLSDGELAITVNCRIEPNRFGTELDDDIIFSFSSMAIVTE